MLAAAARCRVHQVLRSWVWAAAVVSLLLAMAADWHGGKYLKAGVVALSEEVLEGTVEAAAGTIRDTHSWYISLSARPAAGGEQEVDLLRLELDEVQLAKQAFREAKQVGLSTTLEPLAIDISIDKLWVAGVVAEHGGRADCRTVQPQS